jgi:hypothetical protein
MLGYLYRLIVGHFGCDHKWKIIKQGTINNAYKTNTIGNYYELQCEKCGDVKVRNLY